jgi:hypothetical protein
MTPNRTNRFAIAALVVSCVALIASTTGLANAAKKAILPSAKPKANGLLLLNKKKQFPASVIPTVKRAKVANGLSDDAAAALAPSCAPEAVDLGTWCLLASPYPLTNEEIGKNSYFWASQKCVELGGYLPTAGQLIGAAARVKLASTIDDSQLTASIDIDATDGLQDRREMSSTLVTTAAGSTASGSMGVTDGSTGDPKQGQPNPTPLPANPSPQTLQYVTVYDNKDQGGFAGSKPVSQPENFRCAFEKIPGAADTGEAPSPQER